MSGRYARYPDCRDTGIEWLNQVPAHWMVGKLAYLKTVLTDFTANGSFASLKERVQYRDEPSFARLVRLTDLRVDLRNEDGVWIDESAYNFLSKSALFGGEFLLANVGAYAGLFYPMPLNKGNCSLGPNMFMAKFDLQRVTREYMAFVGQGQSASSQLFLRARASSAQPKLNKDDFKSVIIAYPPRDEQTQIAKFLDYETARIDALIEKQQQLIALLQEKRQAVISHAVTKGLNPDAPMRDSGVEWLGKVPAHWALTPLMHIVDPARQIMYGIVLPGPDVPVGVPIVKGGDVKPERLKLERLKKTTFEIECKYARSRLKAGDLVYAIRGGVGDVELVPPEIAGSNLTQDAARIAPADGIHAEWLLMSLRAGYFWRQIEQRIVGATVRGINICDLKRGFVAVPPKEEQATIATYLAQRLGTLEELERNLREFLDRLQERRTALISAAVTGKIDVRNWTPPTADVTTEVA